MIYLIIILLILAVLVIVDILAGFRVYAIVYIRPSGIDAGFSLMKPLVDVDVKLAESTQVLTVKLFHLAVYKTNLGIRRKGAGSFNARLFLKAAELRHIQVDIAYGMPNPFSTGLIYAALSRLAAITPRYKDIESEAIRPDYLADEEYLRISANADFRLCHTILNYVKRRIESGDRNSKPESIRGYPVCEYEELFPNRRADR